MRPSLSTSDIGQAENEPMSVGMKRQYSMMTTSGDSEARIRQHQSNEPSLPSSPISCLILTYGDTSRPYQVNDVVEVVGIYTGTRNRQQEDVC